MKKNQDKPNDGVMIGRLALRSENEWWTAYYAMPDTMDEALPLGRIHMMAIRDHTDRAERFIDLMRDFVGDMIEHKTGVRPEWPAGPQPAPESERMHDADMAEVAAIQQARADDNGQSCVEFAKALRVIRENAIDPIISDIADAALRMPWLHDDDSCLPTEES